MLAPKSLYTRINKVQPEDRFHLRQELNTLWKKMGRVPQLSEYMELRIGTALDATDLEQMLKEDTQAGYSYVCVDWIAVKDRLFMLTLRPGQLPQLTPLALSLGQVQTFVNHHLTSDNFRLTLRDTPELLRELDPLIAPLAHFSTSEELLIFSPTGPLHALPLHALEIDSNPLLLRNPIVYCSSLNVLRHCLVRGSKDKKKPSAALLGDPNGDRAEAAKLVAYLEQLFDSKPLLNAAVTHKAFKEAISNRNLVHFQGHAVHDSYNPLNSYLALADSDFTAREVFELLNLRAELVTLAACESAANVIATGDEPLGLIPAFLYAGASSVLATLWRVSQTSAALTMKIFYDTLTNSNNTYNKAQALRKAMLTVRQKYDSPYHWAPFVLHGDWH